MSDEAKRSGLFVNKKAAASSAAAPAAPAKPKDVQRRWMYVGVGVVGLVVVSTTLFGPSNDKSVGPAKKPQAAMVSVNPPNADKTAFESKFAQELQSLKNDTDRLKTDIANKDKQLAEAQAKAEKAATTPGATPATPPGVVAPPSFTPGNTGGLGSIATPPPPPAPVTRGTGSATSGGRQPTAEMTPLTPPSGTSDALVFEAPGQASKAAEGAEAPVAATGGATPNARVRYTKNASAGLLPAGAFAPVSLLNGLEAGTSSATQANPMPVLLNVTEQATLPGAAKYRLKSCFVLGTGYGDLSAERVYVRFSRLSCVDKADRLVLAQEVQGYLVDSDGKLGMRGVTLDRQGARLGKALLAGFAQGLSGALGSAQATTANNMSTGMSTSTISGSAALNAAGLSGAQTAASQLAQFYLKEAQAIFPVISVDAGRTGTIVFSNSVALNWTNGENQFTAQVTPTNN